MKNLIGLSLSFCVRDIIEGKVAIDDVAAIFTSTKIESSVDLEEVIQQYKQIYWSKNPELGESITYDLWQAGKIAQPRLWSLPCVPADIGQFWLNCFSEARFKPSLRDFGGTGYAALRTSQPYKSIL